MAYFVAKELKLRPRDILYNWRPAELLVAFGEYSNDKSAEYYNSMTEKQRREHKPKPLKPIDKYAVIFLTHEDIEGEEEQEQADPHDILNFLNF